MAAPVIKAVIFDLDGVLVDACPIHRRTFQQACLENGLRVTVANEEALEGRPTRVKLEMLGVTDPEVAQKIFRRKQELTVEGAFHYPFDPARVSILTQLQSDGILLGVYTNSIRATALTFLASAGLLQFFDVVISNNDVQKPKPNPEGYLKAIEYFGLRPSEVLAVEDSPVGLEAARLSGANVLATSYTGLIRDRRVFLGTINGVSCSS